MPASAIPALEVEVNVEVAVCEVAPPVAVLFDVDSVALEMAWLVAPVSSPSRLVRPHATRVPRTTARALAVRPYPRETRLTRRTHPTRCSLRPSQTTATPKL
jgi:hypothetical protein